jgi:hypothetical protein
MPCALENNAVPLHGKNPDDDIFLLPILGGISDNHHFLLVVRVDVRNDQIIKAVIPAMEVLFKLSQNRPRPVAAENDQMSIAAGRTALDAHRNDFLGGVALNNISHCDPVKAIVIPACGVIVIPAAFFRELISGDR